METLSKVSHDQKSVEPLSYNCIRRSIPPSNCSSGRAGDRAFTQTSVCYDTNSMEPISNTEQHEQQCISGTSNTSYFEWQHCSSVMQQLQQQQQQLRYCDVVFHVHGATFEAHRCVLAACSTYLASVFRKKKVVRDVIRLNNFSDGSPSSSTFQQLLLFAYTGAILLPGVAAAEELLHLADYLQVPHLLQLCSRYLHEQLSSINCLKVIDLAKRYHLTELDNAASALLQTNLTVVLTGSEVLELTQQQLEQLLLAQCAREAESTGDAVLACVVRWLVRQALLGGRTSGDHPSSYHPIDVAPALLTLVPWRHVSRRFVEALLQVTARCLGDSHRLVPVLARCSLEHHLLPRHLHHFLQDNGEESAVDVAAFNDLAIRTAIENYQLPVKEHHGATPVVTRGRAITLDDQTHSRALRRDLQTDVTGAAYTFEETKKDKAKKSGKEGFSGREEASCSDALKLLLDCFQQHESDDEGRDIMSSSGSSNCNNHVNQENTRLNTEPSEISRTTARSPPNDRFRNGIASANHLKVVHSMPEKMVSYSGKSGLVKEESNRHYLPLPSMHSFGERFSRFTAENNDSCQDVAGHVQQSGARREFRLVPSRRMEDDNNDDGQRVIDHHHQQQQPKGQKHQHHHHHHLSGGSQNGESNRGVARFEGPLDVTSSCYREHFTLGTTTTTTTTTGEYSHVDPGELKTSGRQRHEISHKMSSSTPHQQHNSVCEEGSCCSYMPPLKRSKVDTFQDTDHAYSEPVPSCQENKECSNTKQQRLPYDPTQIYATRYDSETCIPEDSTDNNLDGSPYLKPAPSPIVDTASNDTRSQFFISSNPEESHVDESMRFNHAFAMFGKESQANDLTRQEAGPSSAPLPSPGTSNSEDTCASYMPQDMTVRKQVQPSLLPQTDGAAPGHLQRNKVPSGQVSSCNQPSRPANNSREQLQFRSPSIGPPIEESKRFRIDVGNPAQEKPYWHRKQPLHFLQNESHLESRSAAEFFEESTDEHSCVDSQSFTDIPLKHRHADVYTDHGGQKDERLLPVDLDASRLNCIKKSDHCPRYSKLMWLKRGSVSEDSNQFATDVSDSKYNSTEQSSCASSTEQVIDTDEMATSLHGSINETSQVNCRRINHDTPKSVFFGRTVQCPYPTPPTLWASSPSKDPSDERISQEPTNPERDLDTNISFEERKSNAKECFNNSSSWLHTEDLLTTPEKILCNTGVQNKSFLSLVSSEFEKDGSAVTDEVWHGLVDGAAVNAHFCGDDVGGGCVNNVCPDGPSRNIRCRPTPAQKGEFYNESEETTLGLEGDDVNHRVHRNVDHWYNDLMVPDRDAVAHPTTKRDRFDDGANTVYKSCAESSAEQTVFKLGDTHHPYCENTLQTLKFKMNKTRRSLAEEGPSGTVVGVSQLRSSKTPSNGNDLNNASGSLLHNTELVSNSSQLGLSTNVGDNTKTPDKSVKEDDPTAAADMQRSEESGRSFKQSLAKYRLRPQVKPDVSYNVSPSVRTSLSNVTHGMLWDHQDHDADDPAMIEDAVAGGEVAVKALTNDRVGTGAERDVCTELSLAIVEADGEAEVPLSSSNHIRDNDVPSSISNGDGSLPHSKIDLTPTNSEKIYTSIPKSYSSLGTQQPRGIAHLGSEDVIKCTSTDLQSHSVVNHVSSPKDEVMKDCTDSASSSHGDNHEDSVTDLSALSTANDDQVPRDPSPNDITDENSSNLNDSSVETSAITSESREVELRSPVEEAPARRKKLKRMEISQYEHQACLSVGKESTAPSKPPKGRRALKTKSRVKGSSAGTPSKDVDTHSAAGSDHLKSEASAVVPEKKPKSKVRTQPLRRQDKRTCDVCDKEFVSRLFFKHMMEHFPGPKHTCDTCERVFGRIYHLLEHRLTHRDVKPHCCPHCPFSTTKRDNLRVHVLSHEDPNQLPLKCPKCERRFARRQLLEHHLTSHSDAKTQRCNLCAYTAKTKNQLALHKRTHTGAVYTCQFGTCAYSTSKKSHFTDHLLTHSERRFFSCSKCGSQYRTKTHLLRHQLSHLPQKPFSCDQCDYSANRADRLKAHKKKMHTPPDESTTASFRRRRQQLKKRDGAQGLPALTDKKVSSPGDVPPTKGKQDQIPVLPPSQDTSHTTISHPSGSVPSDRANEGSCSTRLPSIATLGKGSHGDSLSESSSYPPGTVFATTFVQTIHNGTRIECSQAELFSEMEGSTTTNLSLQPQVSGSPPPTTFSDFTDLQNATEQYSVQFPHPQGSLAKCPLQLPNGILIDSTGDQSCTIADIPDAFVESNSNDVHATHYPQESHTSSAAPTMLSNYNPIANTSDTSAVTFFRSHTSGVSKETSASGSTTLIIEYPHSHDTDLNEYSYSALTAGEKQSEISSHLVEDQSNGNSSDCRGDEGTLEEYPGTAPGSCSVGRWMTYTAESDGSTAHGGASWVNHAEHMANESNRESSDRNFISTDISSDQQRDIFDGVEDTENSVSHNEQLLVKVGKHSLEPSNDVRSHYFSLEACESTRASLINVDSNSDDTITTNSQSLQYVMVNHFRSSGCLANSSVETVGSCLIGPTNKQPTIEVTPSQNFPSSTAPVQSSDSALVLVDSGDEHRLPVDNIADGLNWYLKTSHPDDGPDPSLV